jgi:hypothetical protein
LRLGLRRLAAAFGPASQKAPSQLDQKSSDRLRMSGRFSPSGTKAAVSRRTPRRASRAIFFERVLPLENQSSFLSHVERSVL